MVSNIDMSDSTVPSDLSEIYNLGLESEEIEKKQLESSGKLNGRTYRCYIIPPHIERHLKNEQLHPHLAGRVEDHIENSKQVRGARNHIHHDHSHHQDVSSAPATAIKVYNAAHKTFLPGKQLTGNPSTSTDPEVSESYKGAKATYDFYSQIFGRNSVDNKGMDLINTVHYDRLYDNAFWDGEQMVYGDGDGVVFNRFTKCIDIPGHEITHGVTQYTTGLNYSKQSGALNESISDVFGTMIKQKVNGQTVDKADWLIGQGIFVNYPNMALRSMLHPGTAYDIPELGGKDPQPATMADYADLPDTDDGDNGGVHINSSIPNRAFSEAAMKIGGYSWDRTGKVWYDAITSGQVLPDANFTDFAQATINSAEKLYGTDSPEAVAVKYGWDVVGVLPQQA